MEHKKERLLLSWLIVIITYFLLRLLLGIIPDDWEKECGLNSEESNESSDDTVNEGQYIGIECGKLILWTSVFEITIYAQKKFSLESRPSLASAKKWRENMEEKGKTEKNGNKKGRKIEIFPSLPFLFFGGGPGYRLRKKCVCLFILPL